MRCVSVLLLILIIAGPWRHVRCTCVLESEFGFTLNCAFKKSGLFRVRNLGGIKAHVGLGFTVGDELGFGESLSNLEGNRRRAAQTNRFQNAILAANANKNISNKMTVPLPPPVPNSTANRQISPGIPPFKPIPPAQERPLTGDKPVALTAINMSKPVRMGTAPVPAVIGIAVPAFEEMPSSISRISQNSNVNLIKPSKLISIDKDNKIIKETSTVSPEAAVQVIKNIPDIGNISMEAIEAAILFRQQQLTKQKQQQAQQQVQQQIQQQQQLQVAASAQVTSTIKPNIVMPIKHVNTASKVMNAPKEYYPVGYDKNFDDNFVSKVELPETSFDCGGQKHFPGLYADPDLGCMVFHVCALTDDGLIMKSFLCPESTLFDQTILKCNWWFYVDCKNSEKFYDSNIPVSKSYQLMKALTFFSSYKKDANSRN